MSGAQAGCQALQRKPHKVTSNASDHPLRASDRLHSCLHPSMTNRVLHRAQEQEPGTRVLCHNKCDVPTR